MQEKDSFMQEPSDIRTEPFTFAELGIQQMKRINIAAQKASSAKMVEQRFELLALEGAIVAFAAFIPSKKAEVSVVSFKKRLRKGYLDDPDKRVVYFNLLIEWYMLLVVEFYAVGNVIPAKSVSLDFGDLPVGVKDAGKK